MHNSENFCVLGLIINGHQKIYYHTEKWSSNLLSWKIENNKNIISFGDSLVSVSNCEKFINLVFCDPVAVLKVMKIGAYRK